MKQKKQNALSVLLGYAGSHRRLTLLGLGLSAVSMVCSMIPYLCIWLAARDLIAVAPDWTQARSVTDYGWIAFAFAVGGILIYFLGLMCTHSGGVPHGGQHPQAGHGPCDAGAVWATLTPTPPV